MSSRTHTYNHTAGGSADIVLKCWLYKNTLELLVFVDPVLFSLKWRSNPAANGFCFVARTKCRHLTFFCKTTIRSNLYVSHQVEIIFFISSLSHQVAEETVKELHPGKRIASQWPQFKIGFQHFFVLKLLNIYEVDLGTISNLCLCQPEMGVCDIWQHLCANITRRLKSKHDLVRAVTRCFFILTPNQIISTNISLF